jgi:hypothetical protein
MATNYITDQANNLYHDHDKNQLAKFLLQPAVQNENANSQKIITNAERLGLATTNLETLHTNEKWVSKLTGVEWNNETPKRITVIKWNEKKLAGNLDLTDCTALDYLECWANQITGICLYGCTALTKLDCADNQLTTLDLKDNTALYHLICAENQLTTLDLHYNINLVDMVCSYNQLTVLNINHCTQLNSLLCSENQLTHLDLSTNTALSSLGCDNNKLTSLDVSDCGKLDMLFYHDNAAPFEPTGWKPKKKIKIIINR